jgi:hypothetical protein
MSIVSIVQRFILIVFIIEIAIRWLGRESGIICLSLFSCGPRMSTGGIGRWRVIWSGFIGRGCRTAPATSHKAVPDRPLAQRGAWPPEAQEPASGAALGCLTLANYRKLAASANEIGAVHNTVTVAI